jgi:hypothetical protein
MAKKAPVAPVVLDLPEIKLAKGKSAKANKPDRPIIESPLLNKNMETYNSAKDKEAPINVVDEAIKISQQIESMEVELAEYEKLVKDAALVEKNANLKSENFVKTVDVQGSTFKMQVQFRDAYSKMDVSMREPLKQIFGDKYVIMFKDIKTQTLREEKIEDLKTILGDRFADFFTVEEAVKP